VIISQTPYRVSFAGGGTDLPAFYLEEPGAVLSTTIDHHMYVTVHRRFEPTFRIAYSRIELAAQRREIEHELVREAQRTVETARRPLQRLEQAAQESPGRGLVSPADIDRQRLAVEQAEQQWRQSSLAAQQAQEAAVLALEAAQLQLDAALRSQSYVQRSRSLDVLRQQRVVVETQLELAQIAAPIDAVVLRVDAHEGDSVGQAPLVELADLSEVQCFAEVHEADAPRVQLGQAAQMQSAALGQPLKGRVTRIDSVVGRPQLRSPNPLAPVDFRSVGVTILLDEESAARAARWIQLQVDVTIQTAPQQASAATDTDTPAQRERQQEVNGRGASRGELTGQP
jgi:ABC exporter DevB family membrane fusion protein